MDHYKRLIKVNKLLRSKLGAEDLFLRTKISISVAESFFMAITCELCELRLNRNDVCVQYFTEYRYLVCCRRYPVIARWSHH